MAAGLDVTEKLADVFKSHEQHMSEIFKSHQDVLSAMAQRLLGGTGPQNTHAANAQAGLINNAAAGSAAAWRGISTTPGATAGQPNSTLMGPAGSGAPSAPGAPAAAPAGGPPVGQATPAGLLLPPGVQPPAQPPAINPIAGQTQTGAGGGMQPPPGAPGGPPAGTPSSGGGAPISAQAQGGNGLVDRLWGQVKSRVPLAGLASDFMSEYRSQLDKNAFYRYYAGDSTMGAFDSRFDEERARFSPYNFFSLGEGEARDAFKGATRLGMNDHAQGQMSRGDFVNEAAYAKHAYGAPVGDTLQNAEMLRGIGSSDRQSLRFVTDQLAELTKVAGQAGVSLETTRKNWMDLTEQMAGTFGTAAPAMAFQTTQAQSMMGSSMQNIQFGEQTTNQGYRYMLAGQAGKSISQINAMEMNNPVRFDALQSRLGGQTLKSYIQTDSRAWARLNQMISANRTNLDGDPNFANQIATDWWGTAPKLDPNVFVGLAQAFYGVHFSGYIQATARFIQELAGQDKGALDKDTQSGMGSISTSGKTADGQSALVKTKDGMTKMGSGYLSDLKTQDGGLLGAGESLLGKVGGFAGLASRSSSYAANAAFMAESKAHGGSYNGAMAQLLHKFQSAGEKDPMVQVKANHGEYRVMSLSEAIKGGFESQIAAGQAKFVGGKYGGDSIRKIIGSVDASSMRDARRSASTKTSAGSASADYFKKNPGDALGGGKNQWQAGHVTFGLTKDAAKLLQPTASYADAQGAPKKNLFASIGVAALSPFSGAVSGAAGAVGDALGHVPGL